MATRNAPASKANSATYRYQGGFGTAHQFCFWVLLLFCDIVFFLFFSRVLFRLKGLAGCMQFCLVVFAWVLPSQVLSPLL